MMFGPYPALVLDWHDADTCHLGIDLGFSTFLYGRDLDGKPLLSCRIFGVNAPELSTAAGKDALAFTLKLCPPGTRVTVVSHGYDKFARFDGSLTLPNGTDYAAVLLQAGHAVPYLP